MREFRKRKFIAIVESVMTMMATICIVITLIDGDILGFVLGVFWVFAQVGLVAVSFGLVSKARARLDLRQVYPPKRDHFHRDLERLNKLRGNTATKPASAPLPDDSYVQMPETVLKAHREEMKKELREAIIYATLLEGFRAAMRFMAPFLAIALFGAVIGLLVSLL